jgi:hypothetical protein
MALDHGDPGDAPSVPPPLSPVVAGRRPSAAEEARTIAASTNIATLASLTADGDPWASFVTYGLLDGAPVLCVSRMAEHGRNLDGDPRASLSIVAPRSQTDPLASGRITLAGVVERPAGAELTAARQAHLDAVPAAKYYVDYSDFTLWVMRVHRVRWVGGYGRMDSATADAYSAASPDPVSPSSAYAVADRYGLDLNVHTPRGVAYTRVGYSEPIDSADELRAATVELAKRSASAP